MTDNYILEGHMPVPCNDPVEWANWYKEADRHVARTDIGDVLVSTVFLGIDHSFGMRGLPVLFETMIFGGPHDGYQKRCAFWEDAEKMHARAVALLTGEPQ